MNVFQLIWEVNGPKLSNTVNNNQNPDEWDRTRPKMVQKGKKVSKGLGWKTSKLHVISRKQKSTKITLYQINSVQKPKKLKKNLKCFEKRTKNEPISIDLGANHFWLEDVITTRDITRFH